MLVLINSFRSFSRSILTQADRGLIMQKRKDLPFNIEVFPYINHFIRIPAVTPGCLLCAVRLCGLLRVRINVTVIVCLCQLTGAVGCKLNAVAVLYIAALHNLTGSVDHIIPALYPVAYILLTVRCLLKFSLII